MQDPGRQQLALEATWAPVHNSRCHRGRVRMRAGLRHSTFGVVVLVLGITLAAAVAAPVYASGNASTRSHAPHRAATIFPTDGQGLYESCNPAEPSCLADLDVLARGGFQLVLNYSQFAPSASLQAEIAYAQHAATLGLRILWPVNQFIYSDGRGRTLAPAFPGLDASFSPPGACPGYNGTNYGFVVCLVHFVSSLPGTWGYYIGDELPASSEQSVRPLVDAVNDGDPAHPRLYVATSKGTSVNTTDLAAYARSYCDGFECHADATVIAQDFYPIGSVPPDQIAGQTGAIAGGVEALAQQYGVSYGMVLQAHSLAQYPALYRNCRTAGACPYPTQQQLLAMRDAVLAHPTPRLLLWYSLFDLEHSDNFGQHWSDLQTAANWGKPAIIQGAVTPPAPAATPTVPSKPPVAHAATQAGTDNSAADEVFTPLGRFSATAIEALAQLALLIVLIVGVRIAIGRTMTTRTPQR